MQYEEIRCRVCGSEQLEKQGDGTYVCKHCRAHFRENDLKEYKEAIRGELREVVTEALVMQRAQDIANSRRNLFEAIQEEYTDSYKIVGYCRDLKKLMPNDFQANCFEVLNNGRKKEINAMLAGVDSKGEGRFYIKDMLDFMAKSLTPANLLPLKGLIDRTMDGTEKTEYLNKIEEEAGKYEAGLYSPNVPRKAFIAYSSKDMAIVIPLVGYLESVGISCFVALRNMRHGRGAVENYEDILQRAMHNCKSFVFVSTRNSRRFDCDAMEKEIPYIQDYEPKVKRIEYLVDDYGENEGAAKALLKEFFGVSEWVRNPEDLPLRIRGLESSKPVAQAAVKYCLFCGEENIMTAISCKRCEKREFGTKDEYEARQEELKCQEAERRETERKELKRREEAQREAGRKETERRKVERRETEKKVEVSVESKPTAEGESVAKINPADFEIQKGVLIRYKGKGGAVVIPNSVTSIGDWAFYGCSGLTSIAIPDSVTSIERDVFLGCTGLEEIKVGKGNSVYHSDGNCLIETKSRKLVAGCKNSRIPIDGSVTSIGEDAFRGYNGLTSISIPNSITRIEREAFWGCSSLKSITIPNSTTIIEVGALGGCTGLEQIKVEMGNPVYHSDENCLIETKSKTLVAGCKNSRIPTDGSVRSIGREAFTNCSSLTSIILPNTVRIVGREAFQGCSSLTSITIPNSVTGIEGGAFEYCSSLTSITILNGVKKIGALAFASCSSLTSVTLPNTVKIIGEGGFRNCNSLINIIISNKVKSIGDEAFMSCSSLIHIIIPNRVKNIGQRVFSGCTGLEEIKVGKGNPVYHSDGNCLIETKSRTLVTGCKNSRIPADGSVKCIGREAFAGCRSLTSISIPNSVTCIEYGAFENCIGLASIIVPNSVMRVTVGVFHGCRDSLKIYCHVKKPLNWPMGWDESLKERIIWDK